MFETPTQKNFKKQMKQMQKENKSYSETNIYNSHPKTVSFDKPKTNKMPVSIIISLLIFFSPIIISKINNPNDVSDQTSLTANMIVPTASTYPKSSKFIAYLNDTDSITTNFNNILEKNNSLINLINNKQISPAEYTQGMKSIKSKLIVEMNKLNDINVPLEARSVHSVLQLMLSSFDQYLDSYINGFLDGNFTVDEAELSRTNNENYKRINRAYKNELISAFNALGIKNTINNDGTITYSYTR